MAKILSGEEPYSQFKAVFHVTQAIMGGQKPFRVVEMNMVESYRQLSSQCFSRDPEGRPSIVEITTILSSEVMR